MTEWLLLAAMGMACVAHGLRDRLRGPRLAFAVAGDEDIKIAGGHFSSRPGGEDAAELAAKDFLRQKECGNIDRARDLGTRYAQGLLEPATGPLAGELDGKDPVEQHNMFVLYSYAVNRVIADHTPNSILAQTSLNVFYKDIEEASPDLHKHVSDMAAFSLYILCERSRNRTDDEIGLIFARLCGNENDRALIHQGNRLYDKFYDHCIETVRKISFEDVAREN